MACHDLDPDFASTLNLESVVPPKTDRIDPDEDLKPAPQPEVERDPTPLAAPERVTAPAVPILAQLEPELTARTQLLLARGHRLLTICRDVRDGVKADDLERALQDLAIMGRELVDAAVEVEQLESCLAAHVYGECLTCEGQRAADSLQCRSCQDGLTLKPELADTVLRELNSERRAAHSPVWAPWMGQESSR